MRQKSELSWQLRVHGGRDPIGGRKRYVEPTFAIAVSVVGTDRVRPVNVVEVAGCHFCAGEIGVRKVRVAQIGVDQVGVCQVDVVQIGVFASRLRTD